MDLKVKTLLNKIQPLNHFIYGEIKLAGKGKDIWLDIEILPHRQRQACCSICGLAAPGYDQLDPRRWLFVPIWGIDAWLRYPPRRVQCPIHGVVVELMPWSDGKRAVSRAMQQFLGNWARRLSWQETARVFRVSWKTVYHAVSGLVEWGLSHRDLTGVTALGIDELHVGRGKKSNNFLTLIYQIDSNGRRLLWVGLSRKASTLRKGLKTLGAGFCENIKHVCPDMWKPYLKVVGSMLGNACPMIDRFHVTQHLNGAVDEVRRRDVAAMKARPKAGKQLKNMRWTFLRRKTRALGRARKRLDRILRTRIQTGRAYLLKESFVHFWEYRSLICGCGRRCASHAGHPAESGGRHRPARCLGEGF